MAGRAREAASRIRGPRLAARKARFAAAAGEVEPRRVHPADACARAEARFSSTSGPAGSEVPVKKTILLISAAVAAAAQAPYPITTGKAYKFEAVAPGVYYATST